MMTGGGRGTRLGAAKPSNMNKPMAERMHANILAVRMPEWSEADIALAGHAASSDRHHRARTEVGRSCAKRPRMGGGSDDASR